METAFIIATLTYPKWELNNESETYYYIVPIYSIPNLKELHGFYQQDKEDIPKIVEQLTTGDDLWIQYRVGLPLNLSEGKITQIVEIIYELSN